MKNAVVIVAAGLGTRAKTDSQATPKQFRALAGRTVLERAVAPFSGHAAIDAVLPVVRAGDEAAVAEMIGDAPGVLAPVAGGDSRQASVRAGLEALADAGPDHVLIHDAARPFVSGRIIDDVLAALGREVGAIPAIAVADTVKRGQSGRITETVDRSGLYGAQTPQGFRFAAILEAHRAAASASGPFTDDASIAEWAGLPVALVAGSAENRKLTTAEDFEMAERMFAGAGPDEVRVGTGFDVHGFGDGDSVTLCGVAIPFDKGLSGHSDADVGLHALTDALLGALADGDIGSHFPPGDPQWKGAASAVFLQHAAALLRDRGGAISNVDVTIICEAPKVGPHRPAMRARIADLLGLDIGRVSVKATTSERLGFTGRGEGIAAQAVATVTLPAGAGQ